MGEKVRYTSENAWRKAAMRRVSGIDDAESCQRREIAEAYNLKEGISDDDTLADQDLYIQGKMSLEEYQKYLLFKHSNP
ncbi:MAG: hypothetical protein Q9M08_03425 [Mariprofundus sp.]|nr:hypothetical protein [Mariprofundus sp.]